MIANIVNTIAFLILVIAIFAFFYSGIVAAILTAMIALALGRIGKKMEQNHE